ncbi:hypothetical protein SSX86_024656 [Deinandra increscens subsp. villosa]|uniref:TTF-type domain-containing protein n=1 Tax=Deinandra increscens subsp. villosa TaxID=3103831 RepID=A0AAP0CGA6_9ASTR
MPRKQASGSSKRKRTAKREAFIKSQKGAMNKFLKKQDAGPSNVDEQNDGNANDNVEDVGNDNVDVNVEDVVNENVDVNVEDLVNENVDVNMKEDDARANVKEDDVDIFDPRNWSVLSPNMINKLVEQGPKQNSTIKNGPRDKYGRRFNNSVFTRRLPNMETCDREWLVYSKELDKLFCFCCKLFRKGVPKGGLDNEGFCDWQHVNRRAKQHESSTGHMRCMNTWVEMRQRLKENETIDKVAYGLFKKETDYWHQVILRIISLVKYLAIHNLAFRGSNEKLYQKGNGNFLGLIEMLEEFDPIVKEHVRRIMNDELQVHYLGHTIQNELILLLAKEIQSKIIKKIKRAKYYSIILDCTPDISHQEQMTIIVRYVDFDSKIVKVEESFLGFLVVDDTTGKGLFDVTLDELKRLGLDVDDMRGQGYDNGSKMKGIHQGVQRRFLDINPRAFYTPCGCHSLNLLLCDMANTCVKSREFFAVIQRVYTLFSRSINRWDIMREHVKGLILKPLSTTRWESRVDSVKPIKLYLPDVREALLEVEATDKDALIQSEAKSLAVNMVSDFEFLVAIMIWYEILSSVNVVSKKLQSEDIVLDVAIEEVNKLIVFFKEYREVGLAKAIDEAKIVASEMGVDPVFHQRRIIRKKKQFDDTSTEQEVLFSPEENFKVNYFLYIVDQALASIERRFEQYQQYEKLFGFLFPKRLRQLEESLLKSHCHALEDALKYEGRADIDGDELFLELKLFERFLPSRIISPVDSLQNLKEGGVFHNAMIAYRVLLTIPVTVASAERSFSKLKLLKSYLRSTMSQDRLNGLAMISIESDMLENMNYESLIEDFASKNARRAARFT